MAADVITSTRFGMSPERMQELHEQGVLVHIDLEPGDMPEPKAGELYVGELLPEELSIYTAMVAAKRSMDDAGRGLSGDLLIKIGKKIQSGEEPDPKALAREAEEELVKAYFRQSRLLDYLKAMLHFQLGERFGMHDHSLGVRSKGRVYDCGRKW